ncbi:S8 family peptidase [Marininema halotolerans]|nr:S8 family peptidase [Marininema halotolerans]
MGRTLWIGAVMLLVFGLTFTNFTFASTVKTATPQQKLSKVLQAKMKEKSKNGKLSVIITLKKNSRDQKEKVSRLSGGKAYKNLPSIASNVTADQVNQLAAMSNVKRIDYDETVKAHMYKSTIWFGSHEVNKANRLNITGDGDGDPTHYSKEDATVAIIDTGIDNTHINLDGGKVIGWHDAVNGRTAPYDDQGHGTHVAGIAAGEGSREQNKGAAPGASLVGVKVLNAFGSGSMNQVLAGIDWVISNKDTYGIDVLNMSLGLAGSSNGQDSISLAVNRAAAAGIVPVVSAGNSGSREKTIGSPAAAKDAITVGAMSDPTRGGFTLATFSSRGPTADGRIKPDVSGPGVGIIAPKANSHDKYVAYSGTSMSSPYVAGTAALMVAANPSLTPAEVKSILMSTAHDMGPKGVDIYYGGGKVNSFGAVQVAKYGKETEGLFSTNLHFGAEDIPATGKIDTWRMNVQKLEEGVPISLTVIVPNWTSSSTTYRVNLYDPSGKLVKSSSSSSPQLNLVYQPTEKGEYKAQVTTTSGSGNYNIDLSAYSYPFDLVGDDQ